MALEDELRVALAARTTADLREMREALRHGDLQPLVRLGHRLIGAAGALELHALEDAGRDIMHRAAAGEVQAAREAVERLAALLESQGGDRGPAGYNC